MDKMQKRNRGSYSETDCFLRLPTWSSRKWIGAALKRKKGGREDLLEHQITLLGFVP